MALDSSRTHLRAITFLGAGAALLVVFGYLLMKSDRKKPKRKSSKSNTDEIDAEMESSFNLAIQASKNKQKSMYLYFLCESHFFRNPPIQIFLGGRTCTGQHPCYVGLYSCLYYWSRTGIESLKCPCR